MTPLLSVRDLVVEYIEPTGNVRVLDGVSLDIAPGEIIGLAGESGSGKSTLAFAITRLLRAPAVVRGGHIAWSGRDVLSMDEPALRAMRWAEVSMVFQSAMDALNPVLTIGAQLDDTLRAHGVTDRAALDSRGRALMALVDLQPEHLGRYPHELSGGMRQRACIAFALALQPQLVIMDEPTTALDVVVQRDILQRVLELQARLGFAVLFISHDLPLMLELADRVAVLYAGRLCELSPTAALQRGADGGICELAAEQRGRRAAAGRGERAKRGDVCLDLGLDCSAHRPVRHSGDDDGLGGWSGGLCGGGGLGGRR
jgi:ABC-type glutathione transport system ATPase component